MGKTSKGGSKSTSHQIFKDKARNRVDDLQGMFNDLQLARKENRTGDVDVLEERINHMLGALKAELNEPSPASSQNDGSLGSFSSDLYRLLVDDDATSHPTNTIPELEINAQSIQAGDSWDFREEYFVNQAPPEQEFHETDQFKDSFLGQHTASNKVGVSAQLDYHPYNVHYDIDHNHVTDSDGTPQCGESVGSRASRLTCTIDSPSAFLGPKCVLWDCVRPAKGFEGCQDYCDSFHADLAKKEGLPGSTPVMRCGGIDLKDDVLFAALMAKSQGKDVGIPECEGAATTKSPWNAPELFNFVLEGETVREWFFFEKPRRAFGSGNRKQRSLPDYSGRGWHESRKQTMKELGGLKRFYYMDPQPLQNLELHLYVYESSNNSDVCALYRMELKLVDGKKALKGKVSDNSFAALQKQNTRLTAEFPADDSQSSKVGDNIFLNNVEYTFGAPNQNTPTNQSCFYGEYFVNQTLHEHGSQGFDHCKDSPTGMQYPLENNLEMTNQLVDFHQFDLHKEFENSTSGFMRPKCALWDCSRPAQGSDYCNMFHSTLALNEGPLSRTPVLRPRGISLKDGALFASLSAKIQGKDVGIPECEGAATKKSPWNAPELFDIFFFEGEKIREWLFFDKPRKAFQNGNRIKRSLPDYNGRGWHASRTQAIKEFEGVKKSYYMDPQPLEGVEWHLYEYEMDNCDALVLYRLELKFVDGKKSPNKGKATKDPIVDLQNQMGRLTAEFPVDSVKNETSNLKPSVPANDSSSYESRAPYGYQVESHPLPTGNFS